MSVYKEWLGLGANVALSSYTALAYGIKECIGLKQLLLELGFDVGKIIVHEENQAAQHVAEGKDVSQRSRHIDLRYHWMREQVHAGSSRYAIVQRRSWWQTCLQSP
ncbi:putative DNA-directed DNA polymerase [Phytophthora infestans]|uniref:Putative DNA-directed DNA polymerase n=1 Tax=Phytophthora infestans TaxID=4787 RepID=A0A833W7X9_PHYIN|nr:putative DNA-directed DNA polymerase [Phytophthora infestans]KAF4131812.1 putative DNA-directed DNA polymerase [Phytophthora infestans]